MATERELKYDLDPATLDGDRASVDGSCQSEAESDGPQPVDLDGLAVIVGPSRTITLVADYWDTPSGRLRAWGVTMRHRSASDGSTDAPACPGDEHHGSFVSHRVGS